MPQRILIVLLGAIGDVTRALPLLTRLRSAYPAAYIAWAVEPAAASLVESHPALNEVIVYRRAQGIFAFLPFLHTIRRKKFDLVLDLQRHAKSGLISWWSRAPVRLGFHRTNTKEGNWLFNTHTIDPVPDFSLKLDQYLKFAEALQLPEKEIRFDLQLRRDEDLRIDTLLLHTPRPFAAFFLGSRWPSRFWFPEATAAVARSLIHHYGMGVVLLGGQDEAPFAQEIADAVGADVTDLTGKTSLRDLVGIFAQARFALGPDSGPMHIAAATGIPVISLWGATSPLRSAPWGSAEFVIQGTAACSPCYVRRCPIDRRCMQQITPEQVLTVIRMILQREETRRPFAVGSALLA
ncbi:MAG TPA: lipopolysaccharide heptosyltransferase II [Methylomirabilota bacterium]|nr:lipopolysaccharide heptosyltransferase II [Methylomirabilota bacterium]